MRSPVKSSTDNSQPECSDLSLAASICGLDIAVTNMQYAINRLHFHLDVGSEEFEELLTGTSSSQPSAASSIFVEAPSRKPEPEPTISVPATTSIIPDEEPAVSAKWYAIIVGRDPSVVHGLTNVTPNISRILGAHAIRCNTQLEAQNIFDIELDAGRVEKVDYTITREVITRHQIPNGQYSLNRK